MNKWTLLALFTAFFAIACHHNDKHQAVKLSKVSASPAKHILNPVTDPFPVYNPHLKEYQAFLKGLGVSTVDNAILAAKKYDDLFAHDDVGVRDTAFLLFNKFHFDLSMSVDDQHGRDTTIQYDSLLTDSNGKHTAQITAKTARYEQVLKKNGFRVTSEEGATYIVQDIYFEVDWFKGKLSQPMQEYLAETAKEDKEGLAEDMGLIIPPRAVAQRSIWWEDYVKKYPAIIVSVQGKYNWQGDMEILLTGLDNSPVLSHNPFSLDDSYAKAYAFLQDSYPASQTTQIIKPYFRLVTAKDSVGAAKLLRSYEQLGIIAKPVE